MEDLTRLPNVGDVLVKNLNSIGVFTREDLMKMGSKDAFIRIKLLDSRACLHMLYGIQGAIEGVRYTWLSEDTKQELKRFFNSL